jgi:hypothetical protein
MRCPDEMEIPGSSCMLSFMIKCTNLSTNNQEQSQGHLSGAPYSIHCKNRIVLKPAPLFNQHARTYTMNRRRAEISETIAYIPKTLQPEPYAIYFYHHR